MCLSRKRNRYFESKKIVEAAFVLQCNKDREECKKIYKEISYYKVYIGDKLENVLKRMIKISNFFSIPITTVYNGIQIIVRPKMTVDQLIKIWKTDLEEKRRKRKKSFRAAKKSFLRSKIFGKI